MIRFLVDGYNLLHAIGWARQGMPAAQFAAARRRVIDWLADSERIRTGTDEAILVFDGGTGGSQQRRLRIRYSGSVTADDLIEELLVDAANPREIHVVSNDHRLHEAARRAGATAWRTETFLDHLLKPILTVENGDPSTSEKPLTLSEEEKADLLQAFAVESPEEDRLERELQTDIEKIEKEFLGE